MKDLRDLGEALKERGKTRKSDVEEIWGAQNKRAATKNKKPKSKIFNKKSLKNTNEAIKTNSKKVSTGIKNKATPIIKKSSKKQKIAAATGLVIVGFIAYSSIGLTNNSGDQTQNSADQSDQLGASTQERYGIEQNGNKLPNVYSTDFELIWPKGKSSIDYDIVDVSPPDQPSVYAFIDRFQETDIRISQQELPAELELDPVNKLQELATSFNATDVIEIDGNKIYHGYNGNNGGAQSLVFIKNNLLIFIASPKKLEDDNWFSYISNLQ